MIEKDGKEYCPKCNTEMKRYFDAEHEECKKRDGKALGLKFVPGVLCCPNCYPEKFKVKCKCGSNLLFLYFRDNQGNKRNWVKTKYLYCKKCSKSNLKGSE